MQTKFLLRFTILLVILQLGCSLHAAVIVDYGNLNLASPGRLNATTVNTDATASTFGWGSGYTVAPTVVDTAANSLGLPVYMAAPTTGSVTAAAMYAANSYFTFSITSDFAGGLNAGLLSMKVQSQSNGKRLFSIYATPTGGISSGQSFVLLDSKSVPTTGQVVTDPSLAVASVDLTALTAFQGVDAINVYLIFHGSGSNSGGSANRTTYIDDVILNGSVSIPEPSTMALFGLAAAFVAFRFRRKGGN